MSVTRKSSKKSKEDLDLEEFLKGTEMEDLMTNRPVKRLQNN